MRSREVDIGLWVTLVTPLLLALVYGVWSVAQVKVTYSVDVKQQAAQIAAEIAPKLATLQADFDREYQRKELLPAEKVSALLHLTENNLLGILSAPELAAMRDHVRVRFQQARASRLSDRIKPSAVMLAAFDRAQEQNGSDASAMDQVNQLLARIVELINKNDLIVNLCVTSKPKLGARFSMEPESDPKGGKEALTVGEIVNAYRGRYVYQAKLARRRIECPPKQRNAAGESCQPLDLVDDSRPLLICDFEAGLCHRSGEELPKECRGSG